MWKKFSAEAVFRWFPDYYYRLCETAATGTATVSIMILHSMLFMGSCAGSVEDQFFRHLSFVENSTFEFKGIVHPVRLCLKNHGEAGFRQVVQIS